jgi:glycosyltransferase involved in cell wall biosynthesis
MPRIIVIGSYAESLINFRGSLLKAMVENGAEVFACAPNASHDLQEKLKVLGVKYRNVPIDRVSLNPLNDFNTILKLYSLFRELKPDVILCYTIKPVIYGSLIGRIIGIPRIFSIITGIGYAFSDSGLKEKLINVLVRVLYKLSITGNKRVFFQNPDDRDLFQKFGLVGGFEKVALINGSGVDLDFFHPAPFPEDISFLLIARLIKDKGVGEYIEAIKIVKKKYSQVRFCLAGWIDEGSQGISRSSLDTWIKEGAVEYLGKLDDVRPAIAAASVYLLPSYHEGTPRTVLEAMSMGRPIITTDAPGCRETTEHGRNGFLIPVRDSVALAEAMEQFIRNPTLIKKMGNESRNIVEDKYDVHKVNTDLMDVMDLT